jgi:hypothetical protein
MPKIGSLVTLCNDASAFTCVTGVGNVSPLEREDASSFPSFPHESEALPVVTLDTKAICEAIGQVAFASDLTNEGDQLACVWMQIEQHGLVTVAASDRRRIAVRTLQAKDGSNISIGIFQIPSSSLVHLLSVLPREEVVTLRGDQGQNYLCFDAGSIHAIVQLQIEYGKTLRTFTDRVTYSTIPFLRFLPSCSTPLLKVSRTRLKAGVKRRVLQRLRFEGGRMWVESYGRERKEIAVPIEVLAELPEEIWWQDGNLVDVLSCAGATKDLVLAMEEGSPTKLMVKWVIDGEIQENYCYVFSAWHPYLARLQTKMGTSLSDVAQHILEEQKRRTASERQDWLVKKVREAVLARILLLIECVGIPTEADIQRIVRDETGLGQSFEILWRRVRDKHERDRRFDWLVTQTAIRSFAPGGVTLRGLSLCEELHLDAQEIMQTLQGKGNSL